MMRSGSWSSPRTARGPEFKGLSGYRACGRACRSQPRKPFAADTARALATVDSLSRRAKARLAAEWIVPVHAALGDTVVARREAESALRYRGVGAGAADFLLARDSTVDNLRRLAEVEGREIETIEGMADGDKLHPMQEAFRENHALQCGFCQPGMILSAKALLARTPFPTREELNEALRKLGLLETEGELWVLVALPGVPADRVEVLVDAGAVDVLQPDVTWAGGLTEHALVGPIRGTDGGVLEVVLVPDLARVDL